MNVISQQHQYGNNKELMKRLADASQYKIYPLIIPRNELSLRKILLTTRLWNHVRRQQAMMTIPSSDDWLFQQQSAITQENTKEQDNIPTNDNNQSEHDWSWFNKEAKSSSFLDSLSPEEDKSASRKRTKNEEEEEKQEQVQIKKIKLHFNTIDPPAAPAGPDMADTTHAASPPPPPPSPPSPAVLLSV